MACGGPFGLFGALKSEKVKISWQWLFAWLSSDTEALILNALLQRAMYGLELRDKTGRGFHRIYPALHRLEQRGAIGSYWDLQRRPEQGYARRKYYYLKR